MASFLVELRLMLASEQTLTPERVCELIADRFGGERVYVPRQSISAQDVAPTDTPKKLMARGVKRATAYNWVRRWKSGGY